MMRTFSDLVYPKAVRHDALVRDGLLILSGSLMVAVCAKIQIPGPLPMTLQTFAVVLVGAMLGSQRGALALLAYLLEGAAGLPVFARPLAGPAYFAGDTTGYLIGFVVAAFIVGRLAERGWDRRFMTAVFVFVIGHAVILLLGLIWRSFYVGPGLAFAEGVWKVLPGAGLKTLAAAMVLPAGWKLVRRVEQSHQAD